MCDQHNSCDSIAKILISWNNSAHLIIQVIFVHSYLFPDFLINCVAASDIIRLPYSVHSLLRKTKKINRKNDTKMLTHIIFSHLFYAFIQKCILGFTDISILNPGVDFCVTIMVAHNIIIITSHEMTYFQSLWIIQNNL